MQNKKKWIMKLLKIFNYKKNMLTNLCKTAEVFRFGYYVYFSDDSKDRREKIVLTMKYLKIIF